MHRLNTSSCVKTPVMYGRIEPVLRTMPAAVMSSLYVRDRTSTVFTATSQKRTRSGNVGKNDGSCWGDPVGGSSPKGLKA